MPPGGEAVALAGTTWRQGPDEEPPAGPAIGVRSPGTDGQGRSRRWEEHAMPTSKQRRRIEIQADIYLHLSDWATREGYPVNRFADKLLALALEEYAQAHQNGHRPFGHTLLTMAK